MSLDISQYTDFLVGSIDFNGQARAETIYKQLLHFFSVASFMLGFVYQNMLLGVTVFAVGIILTFIIVVPPYPFYNKNNLKFLDPKNKFYSGESVSNVEIEINQ